MILEYVLKFHVLECLDILSAADLLGYYSLKIDFMKLFESHPDIGDRVLCSPISTLPLCNKDVVKAQQHIIANEEYRTQIDKLGYHGVKVNVHARFFGLPVCPELHRTIFPKNVDVGCFLKVTGTIVRVTQSKMLEYHRKYVCTKCKHETLVEADFEQRYILKAPTKCSNEEKRCKCTTFTQVNLVSREHCKDYQEIKIQEQVNKLSIGTIPGSMWVVLEDDLVDNCKPGDDVNICGTVRRRWRPSSLNRKSDVELVLQANYLEVCNAQRSEVISKAPDVKDCFDEYWDKFEACPIKGRDGILASVCPQVYGLHLVKLALLLTVITSSNHIVESGNDRSEEDRDNAGVRGQCHLLLVGDPGTGKSQLLRAAAELTPRSVFTTGSGSTKAGLTCSALREDGEWQLEAGALVLSDGGVCCIDEIGQLREHDRTSIHEAMEQQTISIAKAGIVCKLNTRCAVVAACNPKGHYDPNMPLSGNVALGTPLLSRFDLIFILLDTKNKAWDKLVSSYILFGGFNNMQMKTQWPLEKLQMYISLVGPFRCSVAPSAHSVLRAYYMAQRQTAQRDQARTTVRMLDSLLRLSQAHCRLMYRTTILPIDAIVAISLVDLSMQDCTLKDTADALHSTFPKHPDFEYLCTAKKLLTRLSLKEIWKEELLRYAKILKTDHKTLENEIDNQNSQIFAKYDDVSDDNIPLSATLITSSYFKVKKKDNVVKEQTREKVKKSNGVNEKLVATLRKHASLNKETNEPDSNVKKGKRKRKEVVINTEELIKVKRTKTKRSKASNNSDAKDDVTNILNAVPSVNDVFGDLGLDLNFGNSCGIDEDSINEKETLCEVKIEKEVTDDKNSEKENCDTNKKLKINEKEVSTSSSTLSKLKQFQYKEKREINKFHHKDISKVRVKIEKNEGEGIINCEKVQQSQSSIFESSVCDTSFNDKPNRSIEKNNGKFPNSLENNGLTTKDNNFGEADKQVKSSQISIFESTDCDIDLDL